MYTSDDGGLTWDEGQILAGNNNGNNTGLLPDDYTYMFQGPGGGMAYNGVIYMPIQTWHSKIILYSKDLQILLMMQLLVIYNTDYGKTWQMSGLLRPEGIEVTSESSIFHYDGKICLAVKAETGNKEADKKRVVYTTTDNGKTWTKLDEDFIPDNVSQCESSSLSLSDKVYLVGYTLDKRNEGGVKRDGLSYSNKYRKNYSNC